MSRKWRQLGRWRFRAGRGPDASSNDGFEFMFNDKSQHPFVLHALPESLDRLPSKGDEGRGDLACLVYIGRDGKPVEVLALTAGYRRVPRLPWLKPLKRRLR
jgi:hypothetical protein